MLDNFKIFACTVLETWISNAHGMAIKRSPRFLNATITDFNEDVTMEIISFK